MRSLLAPLAVALVLGAVACSGHGQSTSSATSEAPPAATPASSTAAQGSASPEGASAAPAGSPGTPTPEPTPTPDANLLSWANGTLVRSYPQPIASAGNNDVNHFAEHGIDYPSGQTGPFVFVFELPGVATISSFTGDLPVAQPSTPPATLTFAVSSTSATSGFTNAGTITATAAGGPISLPATVTGRWVQVTSTGTGFNNVGATGTPAALPAGVTANGTFVELDSNPGKDGAFNAVPTDPSPWYRYFTTFGSGLTAVRCFDGHLGDAYPGDFDGRVWTFLDGKRPGRAFVNDDGSMIVGSVDGDAIYLARTDKKPKFCTPFTDNVGSGPHHVLILDRNGATTFWPLANNSMPGYSYERMDAGMLTAAALADKEMAIFNSVCDTSEYLGKGQGDGLLQWVAAGHKLLIVDADACNASAYSFIPYQFTTSNPGARGASGKRLILVENDALGSSDKTDTAHFLDTQAWVADTGNQLGDANTVTSTDPHWCGHLFGTNADNVNGFMEMYAPYEKGTIIYAGFDTDDSGKPSYDRLRSLEFLLPVPNDLPCTQKVAGSFVIQPSQEGTFTAGQAATPSFSMELLANQGWKGHVAIATSGDFPATVTPSDVDVAGGTQPLKIAVSIPASAKPGAYTVTVTGDNGAGTTEQASITFTGTAPIKKAVIAKHQRIRIYGIHFDYDSAHIQPRSEPVIADIAALMKANPSWHFEVSGHTDSDGGAAYNLNLSQRRAQSVVDDLVKHGIPRSHMVPKGYGLTRPVATNATDAGKALNRRVELERLQ